MKLGKPFSALGSSLALGLAMIAVTAPALRASADEVRITSSILSPLRTSEAPAAEAGVLRELSVSEGDAVTAGDVIGLVDTRRERLLVDVARQDLALAQREAESDIRVRLAGKVHKVAKAELARAMSVNADFPNTVSEKEIERLRLSAEQAALEIEHAAFERSMLELKIQRIQADLRLAEHQVERMQVTAPISGVVVEVKKRAGEWVDQGESVLRLVRVDRLLLEGYVPVEQAMHGLVGRPVRVSVPMRTGAAVEAVGKVTFVSPEAEPVNAQVLFRAEIDNTKQTLRPGLTASMVVIGDRQAQLTLAPGDKKFVQRNLAE